jgi:hypothetical protein
VKQYFVLPAFYNTPGRICGDSWTEKDALIACRSPAKTDIVIRGVTAVDQRTHNVWFTQLGCSGSETNIFQCPKAVTAGGGGTPTSCNSFAMVLCAEGNYEGKHGSLSFISTLLEKRVIQLFKKNF